MIASRLFLANSKLYGSLLESVEAERADRFPQLSKLRYLSVRYAAALQVSERDFGIGVFRNPVEKFLRVGP